MAKRKSSRTSPATLLPEAVPLKFDQKLVLLQWLLWLFDKKSFEQRFKGMTTDEIKCLGVEIAVLGTRGLSINDPSKTYTIDSIPGEFTALELVSIMYAAFQQFAPESDVGIDLSVEYRVAIR